MSGRCFRVTILFSMAKPIWGAMAVSLVPNLTNNYLLLLLNLWVIWPIQALSEFTHLSVSTLLAKDQLKTYYDEKMGFFLNVYKHHKGRSHQDLRGNLDPGKIKCAFISTTFIVSYSIQTSRKPREVLNRISSRWNHPEN